MTPDLQPTLEGPTLLIRPIDRHDWPELFAAAADPLIWEQHPAPDRCQEAVFRKYFDQALASASAFVFVEKASGKLVGSSRYHGYDPATGEIEIGWTFLVRRLWGGRANAEVKKLMLDHAFQFARVVIFRIGEDNLRSQRAVEKLGAVRRPGVTFMDVGTASKPHVVYELHKES